MMIFKRKLGPKGQLLLPKDVRELLNVRPGDEVFIEVSEKEVKVRAATKDAQYLSKFYEVPKKLKIKVNIEKQLEDEYEAK